MKIGPKRSKYRRTLSLINQAITKLMAIAATNKPIVLAAGTQGDQKTDHAAKRPSGDDVGQNEGADRPSQED